MHNLYDAPRELVCFTLEHLESQRNLRILLIWTYRKHSMLCCEFPVLLKLFILLQIYLTVTLDLRSTIFMSLMFIIFDYL